MFNSMQTNSAYTKTKKSNKQAGYTENKEKTNNKRDKSSKPKRDKNLFKSWNCL